MRLDEIKPVKEGDVVYLSDRKRKEEPKKMAKGTVKCPRCGKEMSKGFDSQTQRRVNLCVDCLTIMDEDFVGRTIKESFDFKTLKKRKIKLEPEERDEAMKSKAVWHPSNHDQPVCAIWKSKKASGEVVYGCNTHRVFQVSPTLKGAIKLFHDVVKDTA